MERFKLEKIKYINKSFRLEEGLIEQMQMIATKEDISLNSFVAQACRFAVTQYLEDNPQQK